MYQRYALQAHVSRHLAVVHLATATEELFEFTVEKFKKAAGRRLYPIECHDIMCKIGEVVVVGGVRRSALISLSNLNDDQMAHAKSGQWWENEGQRALANNSVAYKGKPEMGTFMREWLSLYDSKSGERGIFNRKSAQVQAQRMVGVMLTKTLVAILALKLSCVHISSVIYRRLLFVKATRMETLKEKVRLATILGTFQATLTNFKYLRNVWKEEHRGGTFAWRVTDRYHG